jgi:hypothetical protein
MPKPRVVDRYLPRSISADARWRFLRDRSHRYRDRIGGAPNDRQALLIQQLAGAEWDLCRAEIEQAPLREVRECRKLVYFLSAAFERSLKDAPPPPAPTILEVIEASRRARAAEEAA